MSETNSLKPLERTTDETPADNAVSATTLQTSGHSLLERLGVGGMGEVYRCGDDALQRHLAIKILKSELHGDADAQERFLREARLTGSLQHPGIVPVHHLGQLADGRPCYTMKLVRGRTFADMLRDEHAGPERLPRLLAVIEKVSQAVAFAHSRNVIHRDLKPSNVMVGEFGEVQVMDWGLAKELHVGASATEPVDGPTEAIETAAWVEEAAGLSRAGAALGTPAYMPPEQAAGDWAIVDERADVFALGAMLCEILTGQPPYRGSNRDSETASLTETATLQSGSNGPTGYVNSFNSSYKNSISGQVVDTEPEAPASPGGSDSFQRNETYGGSDTVTGSGSYGAGGQTNATYQAAQLGNYNVNDTESDQNETVTGIDSNGHPYTLNYNYTGQLQGSANFTDTHNYQDLGQGITLTSETFGSSGTGTNSYQYSGSYNGQAFDDPSTVPESWTASPATFPGDPHPVSGPDGLIGTFPFQDMANGNGAVYQAPAAYPGVFLQVGPVRSIPKGAQSLYNALAEYAEPKAKKAALVTIAKKELVEQLSSSGKATGTFTFSSGNSWADAAGDSKQLATFQKNNLNVARNANGLVNPVVDKTVVVITYAVDGVATNPRSGDAVLSYKYVTTYKGTKGGAPASVNITVWGGLALKVHDAKIETMDLKE